MEFNESRENQQQHRTILCPYLLLYFSRYIKLETEFPRGLSETFGVPLLRDCDASRPSFHIITSLHPGHQSTGVNIRYFACCNIFWYKYSPLHPSHQNSFFHCIGL